MNNQRAIDRLTKHLEWGWSEETVDAIEMGIHALKETQWIPCSERQPEDEGYILVSFELEEVKPERTVREIREIRTPDPEPEEQIPGQMSVEDFPEVLPEQEEESGNLRRGSVARLERMCSLLESLQEIA